MVWFMDGNWRGLILGLSSGDFWLYSVLLAVTAVGCFYFSFVYLKRARLIEDTPTSKIRSAAQGYVELTGKAKMLDGDTLYAPLSKRPCAWYKFSVQRLEDKHRRTVDSGCSDTLFLLQGDTDQCVIDPNGAVVTPAIKEVWYTRTYPSRVGPHNHGFLSRLGARYRLLEERLQVGEPLYAIGMFRTVGGANDAFSAREDMTSLLKQWKQDKATLLRQFDKNNDGEIDLQEWETARQAAAQIVQENQAQKHNEPSVHTLSKPETGQPYLLSALSPRQLAHHYRRYSVGTFVGFIICSGLTVWMLGVRL